MKQMAHNIAYLTESIVKLEDLKASVPFDCIALRDGAKVQNVYFEVLEPADAGTSFESGFGEDTDFITGAESADSAKQIKSSRFFTTSKAGAVNVTLNQATSKGKLLVGVMYFLPSKILTEI